MPPIRHINEFINPLQHQIDMLQNEVNELKRTPTKRELLRDFLYWCREHAHQIQHFSVDRVITEYLINRI